MHMVCACFDIPIRAVSLLFSFCFAHPPITTVIIVMAYVCLLVKSKIHAIRYDKMYCFNTFVFLQHKPQKADASYCLTCPVMHELNYWRQNGNRMHACMLACPCVVQLNVTW